MTCHACGYRGPKDSSEDLRPFLELQPLLSKDGSLKVPIYLCPVCGTVRGELAK